MLRSQLLAKDIIKNYGQFNNYKFAVKKKKKKKCPLTV